MDGYAAFGIDQLLTPNNYSKHGPDSVSFLGLHLFNKYLVIYM